MKKCTFVYKGKTYSTDRIQRILLEELPIRDQQESIDFLAKYLGLPTNKIHVIRGLIDNRSLGRFRKDGDILLSDLATPDVAYHEAFHRVWRMYLDPEERMSAIKEVKRRKNYTSILESYKKIYSDLTDNELVEEYLADEFSDFVMNSNYKIELPIKSLFQSLLDFIKKILGLKVSDIQLIYDKILAGKYAGQPTSVQQYLKDADKVIIEGQEFTVEQKNELIQLLTQRFTKAMLHFNTDVDKFLASGAVKINKLLDEYVVPDVGEAIINESEEYGSLIDSLYADTDKVLKGQGRMEDSVFLSGMIKNLKLIGLKIQDESEDLSEGSLDAEEQGTREYQASVEVDPKSKIGSKIKFLLSSLTTSEKTSFGIAKPLSWTKGFNQIVTRMAGIPSSVFMDELKKLDLPYIKDLVNLVERDVNFENKFISSMSMTENKFMKVMLKSGSKYFIDANSGTKSENILNEWRNGLTQQVEDWNAWKAELQRLLNGKPTNEDIVNLFGLKLHPAIENLQTDLRTLLQQAGRYEGEKPQSKNLFKDLKIDGYIKNLAKKQSKFEDAVDMMVYLQGKKLYSMGLNTQQSIVLNAAKYAQSLFTPEMSQADKMSILKKYIPAQVSEFNVTELVDGSYLIHNKWIQKILDGEKIDLVIPYGIDSPEADNELSKLEEPDLMMYHLNGALHGIVPSMKHGDRSTFFAYNFGKALYPKSQTGTVGASLQILEDNLIEQIELELKFVQDLKNQNLPIQNTGSLTEGAFGKEILGDDYKTALETGKINETKVKLFVAEQFKAYKEYVESLGLLDPVTSTAYDNEGKSFRETNVKGLDKSILRDWNVDAMLASAFTNEVSNHIFELRFFSGSAQIFKSGTDLFKRLVPQSSTGLLAVNSDRVNEHIRQQLNQEHVIYNPRTKEYEEVNTSDKLEDGYFRAVTGEERDDYKSYMLDPAVDQSGNALISKITGKQESILFMVFEDGFIKDYPDMSIDDLRKTYKPKFELYEKKYSKINENDGQSYITLPGFKNFMIRQGNWNDGFELVYQTEMKIASLSSKEDIANIEIEFKGVMFKPFEINPTEVNGRKIDGWKEKLIGNKIIKTEALHTLKTQFAGYSTPEEYYRDMNKQVQYWFNSIYKTSQHLLVPSAIIGTNLQLMNSSLLKNGIDIYHMGSANKVGGVDPKVAAKNIISKNDDTRNTRTFISDLAERGLDFYDKNGFFNDEALNENADILTYLSEWSYLKDQVQIGNKVKSEIKGSTQSLKILLSNLIINQTERFEGARQLLDSYKEVVRNMVENNHDSLLKRIGYDINISDFTTLEPLKAAILGSSQMLNAPDNIKNAVENFLNDPELGIETVPMKNKIENVLYSLITNGIISFDRPGTTYPQAAITGYETLGTRNIERSNQETLKFYEPVFDEEGNVIKVNPAEIIMPLPDQWIKPLLRWVKTNNLVKALDKLNEDIAKRPELYQFKGLRIPNQQLSSNDFLQVKKFNLPTMQNYILVPSEIVIKVGSDFDIDKLNIYWTEDTANKIFGLSQEEILDLYDSYTKATIDAGIDPIPFEDFYKKYSTPDSLDRSLLDLEKQILLHPRNIHHLLMPLTDEIFVKDIYEDLINEGVIKTPGKTFFGSVLPQTNVKNTVIFVKGKFGVGPVALSITNSAVNQADGLELNPTYRNNKGVFMPTKLLFKGLEDWYRMDSYVDANGTVITEILSQLLTTQVDNVKNPTAVLMNINMQTLGVINYLVRRKVAPKSIVLLLQQPIVKEYLRRQAINESIMNKDSKGEIKKDKLILNLLKDFKLNQVKNLYDNPVILDDKKLLSDAKKDKMDQDQAFYLAYFDELVSQARTFSDFQQTQNSDTKGLKDKQALDETEIVQGRVFMADMVPSTVRDNINLNGVIAPFYQFGRRRYYIFDRFYRIVESDFGSLLREFKDGAAAILDSSKKDKVRQTIENDFILFLIHNFALNKDEFNRIMKDQSVPKRVLELKKKVPSNLVLKAFFPILNNTTDLVDNKKIDNLRLFEKELLNLDSNDLKTSMEEVAELDIDLYTDIIKMLMFQSGLNISPFNYRSVVPVGLDSKRNEFNLHEYIYQDLIKDAVDKIDSFPPGSVKATFEQFKLLFAANNPQFLRDNFFHPEYPYKLARVWNREEKRHILKPQKGNGVQIQLGDAYHKQYFVSLINPNLFVTKQAESKETLNEVFDEEVDIFDVLAEALLQRKFTEVENENIPFTDHEDVTNPKVLALEEGEKTYSGLITKLEENQIFVFGSNPVGINGNPEKGTGGAALVATNNKWVEQREKMDNRLSDSGKAWGLTTVAYPGRKLSKTPKEIKMGIQKLYAYAKSNPTKEFLIAYTGTGTNLNGYSNQELADMFSSFEIPNNIVFEKQFSTLLSKRNIEKNVELDQSQSNYSPSLEMYKGFIQTNKLYEGEEILPFVGESEYYRYLVPMLLKMNPEVKTEFTEDMGKSLRSYLPEKEYDYYGEFWKQWPAGMSIRSKNTNVINFENPNVKLTTIVHELIHRTLQKEYENGNDFTNKINKLYDYAQKFDDFTSYGFTSETEFLAEALSNPDFMEVLNNIPYEGQTVWSYLMTLASDFINNLLGVELNSDSVLAEVIRVSEQVLNKNLEEVGKLKQVTLSELGNEIVTNWNDYFPQYDWMNLTQKEMAAKLIEEGKVTLNCKL